MIRTRKELMRPPFIANHKSAMRDTGRQVAFELLTAKYKYGAVPVTLENAVTAADTDADIAAPGLPKAMAKGEVIDFGGGKVLVLSAPAAKGAILVYTEAAAAGIADAAVGYYGGNGKGYVLAGTEVDLLADGRVLPSDIGTANVTCYGILETSAEEDSKTDAMSGYGCLTQCMVYENLLPNSSGSPKVMNSTHKTELLARGGAWLFLQYADNT